MSNKKSILTAAECEQRDFVLVYGILRLPIDRA